ncbi:hypothetical protein LG047_01655 [Methylocystis sp. WRRC1]|uniref:hypothetical protein n=1 Tax=Methylocystis sp. WRRC1 TaxID=1732014 RepID=UPI001D1395C3|nr:hypothetical protein [Methylocystis sp. WRRC1]MCC3244034.1 hypothetical protein [Methylocystis sp. WRRC1]
MKTTARLRANVFETLETSGTAFDPFFDEAPQLFHADRIGLSLGPPLLDGAEKRITFSRVFAAFNGGRYFRRKVVRERKLNQMPAHCVLRIVTVLSNQ